MEEKIYSVWVGGGEVNDNYLTKNEAISLAKEYEDDGYDDVVIVNNLYEFEDDEDGCLVYKQGHYIGTILNNSVEDVQQMTPDEFDEVLLQNGILD